MQKKHFVNGTEIFTLEKTKPMREFFSNKLCAGKTFFCERKRKVFDITQYLCN